MACSTPVVFIIFRRPDLTARVFEAIRQAQPKKLLVVADGPRTREEATLCQEARAIIENIDWDCEVFRNYSSINMGCRDRVSSGLTWAFEQVEEAIILEDDCLPDSSFFRYCEELLKRYRFDTRIMQIGGNNSLCAPLNDPFSYYFSGLVHIWGWATWRRAWSLFDVNISTWPSVQENYPSVLDIFENSEEIQKRIQIFDSVFDRTTNAWGYSWLFSVLTQHGLTILPTVNLVSNIGFREDAVHTTDSSSLKSNLPVKAISFPLKHPTHVIRSKSFDRKYLKLYKASNCARLNQLIRKTSVFKSLKKIILKLNIPLKSLRN